MVTITIIGTGLIGCSIGMALRKHGHFIIGYDSNFKNLAIAEEVGAIDASCKSILMAIEKSQAVILATPVDVILEILPDLLSKLPNNAWVMDAGSTKTRICQLVNNHPRRDAFLAAHPMAGSEQSGPLAASPNLLIGKRIAICEKKLTSEKVLTSALEIINQLQLIPIYLTPNQHDEAVAIVSHIPQVIAYAFAALPEFNDKNVGFIEMASTGFDSSTRLSSSSMEVWPPILLQNKEFIGDAIQSLITNLNLMADCLATNNTAKLQEIISKSINTRKAFDLQKLSIEKENHITTPTR